jgi:hypothetical protein
MTNKGGLTIPLLECLFHGSASTTHFLRDFDLGAYNALPHIYIAIVVDKTQSPRTLPAGLVVKTSYTPDDPEFTDALLGIVALSENIGHVARDNMSFVTGKVGVPPGPPLSENEMVRALMQFHFKHAPATSV